MQAFRQVKIDWRAKAFLYNVLDTVPLGERLYNLAQRHVTRTIPRKLKPTAETAEWLITHARVFRERYKGDISAARYLEFGAGWDLFSNLIMWCYGLNFQTVIDIRRWARPDQVNHVIRHLQVDPPPGAVRVPEVEVSLDEQAFDRDLRDHYGIAYLAPADVRRTGLPSSMIDLIATTSTLEHIPSGALEQIMAECRRLSHPDTVQSHVIDYSDHYAHSDAGITIYNFLRFSDEQWQRYNPGIHYQNRLRHGDYSDMFRRLGFRIDEERAIMPDDADELLSRVPVASSFEMRYLKRDLEVRCGHFVLGVDD